MSRVEWASVFTLVIDKVQANSMASHQTTALMATANRTSLLFVNQREPEQTNKSIID